MATFQKKWRWQLKKLFEDFQSAIRETVNIDEALELAQAYGVCCGSPTLVFMTPLRSKSI